MLTMCASCWRVLVAVVLLTFVVSPLIFLITEDITFLTILPFIVATIISATAGWYITQMLCMDRTRKQSTWITIALWLIVPVVLVISNLVLMLGVEDSVMLFFGVSFIRATWNSDIALLPQTFREWLWLVLILMIFSIMLFYATRISSLLITGLEL